MEIVSSKPITKKLIVSIFNQLDINSIQITGATLKISEHNEEILTYIHVLLQHYQLQNCVKVLVTRLDPYTINISYTL